MLFKLDRSSGLRSEDKQKYKAFTRKVRRVDEGTSDDPEKIPGHRGQTEWWYQEGTNHRVEDGHIKRDFDDEVTVIEVTTLSQLCRIIEDEGTVVIVRDSMYPDIMSLEIYDSYRE